MRNGIEQLINMVFELNSLLNQMYYDVETAEITSEYGNPALKANAHALNDILEDAMKRGMVTPELSKAYFEYGDELEKHKRAKVSEYLWKRAVQEKDDALRAGVLSLAAKSV